MKIKKILFEGGTSRLYNNITNMENWAIISPFRSERTEKENMSLLILAGLPLPAHLPMR